MERLPLGLRRARALGRLDMRDAPRCAIAGLLGPRAEARVHADVLAADDVDQVVVDPQRLAGYGITIDEVTKAIRASNRDVGGRVIELAEKEYMVRGRGYLRGTADIAGIVLKSERGSSRSSFSVTVSVNGNGRK